jgi:hypothetical protein
VIESQTGSFREKANQFPLPSYISECAKCFCRLSVYFLAHLCAAPQTISAFQHFPCGFTEPHPPFAQGQAQAPTRRSVWIGTVPPAAWPDSSVCRLSIPLHCNCASFVSVPLHFKVVKADETG